VVAPPPARAPGRGPARAPPNTVASNVHLTAGNKWYIVEKAIRPRLENWLRKFFLLFHLCNVPMARFGRPLQCLFNRRAEPGALKDDGVPQSDVRVSQ
jgi:hypothetical protein